MDSLDLLCFYWAAIGFVLGAGLAIVLCHNAPVTDDEKRALIRRWKDELGVGSDRQ